MPHYSGTRSCAKEECPNFFANHEWGNKAAQRDGWFMQRNGNAWCPDHTPEWVAEWREKKRKIRESSWEDLTREEQDSVLTEEEVE